MEALQIGIFIVAVLALLILDLLVFNKKGHEIKLREALGWTAFWVSLAMAFNVFIYFWKGPEAALQFLAGYLIEESLSVDNLFVFIMVFAYFKVPPAYQHRVLFWGIVGALAMRLLFIIAGIALIERFHFLVYVLGVFLIYAGFRMVFGEGLEVDPKKNKVLGFLRRFIPMLKHYHGDKFFVKRGKTWFATPLLFVLITIELTDVVFALDSIPAVLAISKDPFIIFTSNIFAILGLRSLFFALAKVMNLFHYLKYGLAIILSFVGVKIMIADWVEIPIGIALGVVAGVLFLSIAASLLFPQKTPPLPEPVSNAADEA
jgi:tellurite resistance protein TerC